MPEYEELLLLYSEIRSGEAHCYTPNVSGTMAPFCEWLCGVTWFRSLKLIAVTVAWTDRHRKSESR